MRLRDAAAATFLAALTGCASCDSVPAGAVTDCNAQVVPGGAATDVLFVVDDSGSMNLYQTRLAANLATFIDQLMSSAIQLDLRVGVTSTSVAEGGATVDAEGPTTYAGTSGPSYGKPYPQGTLVAILDPDGVVTPGKLAWDPILYGTTAGGFGGHRILSTSANAAADLKRYFKANVRLGRWGSGKEQPLRAMKLAIDKAHRADGENFGFLRDGARLAVVVLTDEDDCSQSQPPFVTYGLENSSSSGGCHNATTKATGLDPLADYATLLDTTVGGEPIFAVVAGFDPRTLDPVGCTTGGASALDDPTRLDAFLTMLSSAHANRTFKESICSDFGPALLRIAAMIIPQTMPLQQAPAEWRMLAVAVQKGSGGTVGCRVEKAGTAEASLADVVYTPAPPGGLPSLTFQNGCLLGFGDKVDLRIVCAR